MQGNIGSVILKTFEKDSNKVFLKSYINNTQYTGKEAIDCIIQIASNLIAEGNKPKDCIAIYSQNCPEWSLVDLACMQSKLVSVPIFATNNSYQTDYILKDSGANTVFVGSHSQYAEILKIDRKDNFNIIVFDPTVELQTTNSIHFKDWLNKHKSNNHLETLEQRKNSIQEEDLVTLIYTSGTTGKPKGVQLHHGQFNAILKNHNAVYDFKKEYTSICFLPLSHVYERGWTYIILANGLTNVYLSDPKIIAKALYNVKPDAFCAVPRLYEKIYRKVMDEVASQSILKKKIFYWAIEQGKKRTRYQEQNKKIPGFLNLRYKLANQLVFKKIKQQLGGNLVICPCGGAYIADQLVDFFRAIGLPLLVGYGLTESTATVTSFTEENFKVGTVGKPIVNVEVKIGENNEILVKGKTVTSGYYKLEEESKDIFTEDGWLKTGDAGHLDKDGYLVITDRIKQLIKTANGKYIAPQLVEGHLTQSPFISQAMVVGEGKPYASALFTLDQDYMAQWAKYKGIPYQGVEEIVDNEVFKKSLEKSLRKEQASLSGYEKVKRYRIIPREFTMEEDELTPTLKLKRKVILEKYAPIIDSIYH